MIDTEFPKVTLTRGVACPKCGWDAHTDEPNRCENCRNEGIAAPIRAIHQMLRAHPGIWPKIYVDDYDDNGAVSLVVAVSHHREFFNSQLCDDCTLCRAENWIGPCNPGWMQFSDVWADLRKWIDLHGNGDATEAIDAICVECGFPQTVEDMQRRLNAHAVQP
jgi:hypothetical protein